MDIGRSGDIEQVHGTSSGRAIVPATKEKKHCRTNSRRGQTDPSDCSYPPVASVCRALKILSVVNHQRIATVNSIYSETRIPKPTIVRMLETLMAERYVARDNMCGGYRVTKRVATLSEGYCGISRVIEIARPMAIDLTRRIKWPIGLGVIDGDAIEIQFWTGTISPLVHTNTVLGNRPDLLTTAMGRAYLAYCADEERERHLARFRIDPEKCFGETEEGRFRLLLENVRSDGYASRDPRTEPLRMTTLAVPFLENGLVQAVMSVSFYTSAIQRSDVRARIVEPLSEARSNIEHALAFMSSHSLGAVQDSGLEVSF